MEQMVALAFDIGPLYGAIGSRALLELLHPPGVPLAVAGCLHAWDLAAVAAALLGLGVPGLPDEGAAGSAVRLVAADDRSCVEPEAALAVLPAGLAGLVVPGRAELVVVDGGAGAVVALVFGLR